MNKKLIIGLVIITAIASMVFYAVNSPQVVGGTTLKVPNGGTGATSFTAGECIVGNGTGALTSQVCGTGVGGGGGGWATTTNGMVLYPDDKTDIVVVGNNATSTTGYMLEVFGASKFNNAIATGTLTVTGLTTLGYASTTVLSATTLYGALVGNVTGTASGNLVASDLALYETQAQASSSFPTFTYASSTYATSSHTHASYLTSSALAPYETQAQASSSFSLTTHSHDTLYDILGQATSTLASHTTAYNHANFLINGSIDTIGELNAILTGEDVASTSGTYANITAGKATALAADPSDCSAGQFANAIDGSGNLTCAATSTFYTFDGSGACATGATCTGGHNHDVAGLTWANDWMIAYSNGTGLVELAFGDQSGKYLKSNGEGALSWDTPVPTSDGTWTSHNNYPSACTAGQYVTAIGDTLTCAATSTFGYMNALSDNTWTLHNNYPAACPGGQVVTAIGDTLTCVATSTNANTATALAANPTDCGATEYATGIDASGNLTCSTPAGTGTVNSGTLGQIAYYSASSATISGTSTISIDTNQAVTIGTGDEVLSIYDSKVGIGTTTPNKLLLIGGTVGSQFGVNSTGQASSTALTVSGTSYLVNISHTGTMTLSATGVIDAGSGAFELPNTATCNLNGVTGRACFDTTNDELQMFGGSATTTIPTNFYPAFTSPATTTAWTGTSTWAAGTAFIAETWNAIQCFTDAGTLDIQVGDGTNWMNLLKGASTTVSTFTFSTNNTFTALEKRYFRAGNPATSPTYFSCTVSKKYNSN